MNAPLPFIAQALTALPRGRLLDVACGQGRHLRLALGLGFQVTGVDRDREALAACPASATRVERDVERDGLPPGRFDVVLTTFFLHRPLVAALPAALVPGGIWLMETFHVENHLQRAHPGRRVFAWEHGEAAALARAAGLTVESVDEGDHDGVFTVQLRARAPNPPRGT